jgi:hypothetical protein
MKKMKILCAFLIISISPLLAQYGEKSAFLDQNFRATITNYNFYRVPKDPQYSNYNKKQEQSFFVNLNVDVMGPLFFTRAERKTKLQFRDYWMVGFGVGFGKEPSGAPVNLRLALGVGASLLYEVNDNISAGVLYIPFGFEGAFVLKAENIGYVYSNMLYPTFRYKSYGMHVGWGFQPFGADKGNFDYKRLDIGIKKSIGDKLYLLGQFQYTSYKIDLSGTQSTYSLNVAPNFTIGLGWFNK